MRRHAFRVCIVLAALSASIAHASIFGRIQGIVHDPQHRPIAGATVVVKSATSAYAQTKQTDDEGGFDFQAVTLGDYSVTVSQLGFESSTQTVTVTSGSAPILHFQLRLSTVNQTATVTAQADAADMDSVTPTTLISRK